MTLWLVPVDGAGLSEPGAFDGLGLRGNASRPITADGVVVPADALLGADGAGLDIALSVVLPDLPGRATPPSRSGSHRPSSTRPPRTSPAPGSSTSASRLPSSRPPGRSTRPC